MKGRSRSIRGACATAAIAALLGAVPLAAVFGAAAPPPVTSAPAVPAAAPDPISGPPGDAVSPGGASEDIRDIRGPKHVFPAWFWPAVLIGGAVLALGAYGLWRALRRRRRPRALLPFEAALQRLEALRPLMQPENAREFSIAVTDIVRSYIEQRFDVTATHRTTEEFLHDLLESPNPSLARHRGLLAEFLQQCDLVKFGGMSLSRQSMESLQQSARAFVLETAKPEESRDSLSAT
jgi:hypothetical protein